VSSINGDKSRHQINRKRAVLRRMKIRKLVADKAQPAGTTEAAAPAKSSTSKPR
jgi:hypothetical protein